MTTSVSSKNQSNIELSKCLSWILRHGALDLNLPIESDGYLPVAIILKTKQIQSHKCTANQIRAIVAADRKQRFSLITDETGVLKIKANQGHSIKTVNLNLHRIQSASEHPICVHGTYYKHWPTIKIEGLKRMTRQHIHFAAQDRTTIDASGFRENCQLLIYIDLAKALADGIEFFRSENNVILSSGIDGILLPKYFSKVIDRRKNTLLSIN